MNEPNQFANRVDKLALFYISNHFDITKMTVKEFINEFNKAGNEIVDLLGNGSC